MSARTGEGWRIGVEYMNANMFGPHESHEERAWMLTPVFEYAFASSGRVRPFLSFGIGLTQWRSLIPEFRSLDSDELAYMWERQHTESTWRAASASGSTSQSGSTLPQKPVSGCCRSCGRQWP